MSFESYEKIKLLETLREAANNEAKEHFYPFVKMIAPILVPDFVDGRHIEVICEELEHVERTPDSRLMIFLPPRSMKSRLGSMLFPLWCLGRHPTWDVMAVSYAKELAMDFSREVRNTVKEDQYLEIFPSMGIRPDSRASNRWHTLHGGQFTVGSITAGIAGKGAHVGIIDDPLSEQDAFSATARRSVQQWYPGGMRTRLAPGGRIVYIGTRWHQDDLAGWLLRQADTDDKADQWRIVTIPGILDEDGSKLLGYKQGTSYWPQRWSTERLTKTKANMPPSQWAALYQQNPVPEGGSIFVEEDFSIWDMNEPPEVKYVFFSLDTAFSTAETADYSAITTWGIFHRLEEDEKGKEVIMPHLILLGAMKGRWTFSELLEKTTNLYEKRKPDAILVEKKASGQSLIQELYRFGLPVVPYNPDKDKISRANAVSPIVQQGRVWVPEKKWAEEFVTECCSFPFGTHDDYVDTFTQAVLHVRDNFQLIATGDEAYKRLLLPKAPRKKVKTYWTQAVDAA